MNALVGIAFVFIGCCSNVIFLELLVTTYPGCGNLVTFAQFLIISIEGFIFTTKFGTVKPEIPVINYCYMVVLFFLVSVVNNYAINFNISMPLHMIFRSGSLIANMILGIIILKKKYTIKKYLSILMISMGICICTIMSAQTVSRESNKHKHYEDEAESDSNEAKDFIIWLIGIGMLTFALFMSARMGIYQEVLYKKHGKHPREALFYSHAIPLAAFVFIGKDIIHHASLFSQSEPVPIPVLGVEVPILWLYMLGNCITQYVCIRAVFFLTTECSSLVVTLVVTLRKFLSLIFSIIYFQNPFTFYHWIGTGMVFGGTLIFLGFVEKVSNAIWPVAKKEEKVE
ncbi:UDP-xylose and UDP-N-acetylglucosamine transporter-like [Anneissia japonica]|uniref:UDP-xylose and UDP-N-acetylglucosamine transporter-like n=1 Tax=Anneissia japonica TaxID=1529436 RepID=UPI00142584E8|nr:UDP-xylose and UDP-N-acetylglucosamine transporter-like [Anneissia japonica]